MSFIKQIFHIVFRTKNSFPSINEAHEKELYAYIMGILNQHGTFLYRINGMPDHIHILVNMPSDISLSQLMKEVKQSSSIWLKENVCFPDFEGWAEGYAAFSYGSSQVGIVKNYIIHQKEHHRVKSFRDEYREFLIENGVSEDEPIFLNKHRKDWDS